MPEKLVRSKAEISRVKTYIEGLDDKMQGGIPEGHISLLSGAAGTMKSSVAFNVLYNEARLGKTALYLSLEQSYSSLLNHMINMDFDLTKVNLIVIKDLSLLKNDIARINASKQGNLILVDVGCIRKEIKDVRVDENRSWLNVIKNILKKIKTNSKLDLFALDSLSALYVLSKFSAPRVELFYIFEFLRDMNVTTFLISETPLDGSRYGEYDEDFLSDGIIYIKLSSYRRKQVREITVVKMRTTKCDNDTYSLSFENGKFRAEFGGKNPLL